MWTQNHRSAIYSCFVHRIVYVSFLDVDQSQNLLKPAEYILSKIGLQKRKKIHYLSFPKEQVAVGTFFMKSPVPAVPGKAFAPADCDTIYTYSISASVHNQLIRTLFEGLSEKYYNCFDLKAVECLEGRLELFERAERAVSGVRGVRGDVNRLGVSSLRLHVQLGST